MRKGLSIGEGRIDAICGEDAPLTVEDRLIPSDQPYRLNRSAFWVESEWPFGKTLQRRVIDPIYFAGEPVTWTNADSAAHTVTSQAAGTFDSGAIAKGRSWTLPSLQPGTYAYYCRIHAWMRGQLRVEA